jgi:hypothetical protein
MDYYRSHRVSTEGERPVRKPLEQSAKTLNGKETVEVKTTEGENWTEWND